MASVSSSKHHALLCSRTVQLETGVTVVVRKVATMDASLLGWDDVFEGRTENGV